MLKINQGNPSNQGKEGQGDRWCRRIFLLLGLLTASIHEQRRRLQEGVRPAFECRKCGVRLARHFGRARRLAHEQYCLGSAVANFTCRKCGELFVCKTRELG